MIQHKSPISGVAAFSDQYIATAGYDNQVILWDAQRNQALGRGVHDHLANQCEFSPCGRYLLSTSSDYTVRLWKIPSMQLTAVLGDHEDDVEAAVFHASKAWIATASRDKWVRLFDFKGHLIHKLYGHQKDVISLVWCSETELLSCSDDGSIRKWDMIMGKQLDCIDLGGIETDTIALTAQGSIFAGNDKGQIIRIDSKQTKTIDAHAAGIKKLAYSQAHNKLVSLSYDRYLFLWTVNPDGSLQRLLKTALPNCVWARSCVFLGENKIVLATFGSQYALYDYQNNHWDTQYVQETQGLNALAWFKNQLYAIGDAGVLSINFKPHMQLSGLCNFLLPFGETLICGGQTGEVYDALTGEVLYQHQSPLNCAAQYEYQGRCFAIIGAYTGEGIVLGLTDNQEIYLHNCLGLHENAIKGIAANQDFIFSVCADYSAAFHRIEDFNLTHYLEKAHDKIANACVRFKDQSFISASRDLKLRLFEGDKIKEFKTKHQHSIKCLAVSSDYQFIASADYAGYVFVYDQSFKIIFSDRPTTAGISSLIFKDRWGECMASSYDGGLYPISFYPLNAEPEPFIENEPGVLNIQRHQRAERMAYGY